MKKYTVFFEQSRRTNFQVLAKDGEDTIYYCDSCQNGINQELFKGKEGDKCQKCKKGKIIDVSISANYNIDEERFFVFLRDMDDERNMGSGLIQEPLAASKHPAMVTIIKNNGVVCQPGLVQFPENLPYPGIHIFYLV